MNNPSNVTAHPTVVEKFVIVNLTFTTGVVAIGAGETVAVVTTLKGAVRSFA